MSLAGVRLDEALKRIFDGFPVAGKTAGTLDLKTLGVNIGDHGTDRNLLDPEVGQAIHGAGFFGMSTLFPATSQLYGYHLTRI